MRETSTVRRIASRRATGAHSDRQPIHAGFYCRFKVTLLAAWCDFPKWTVFAGFAETITARLEQHSLLKDEPHVFDRDGYSKAPQRTVAR